MKSGKKNKIFITMVLIVLFTLVLYFSLNENVNVSLTNLKDMLYMPFNDINNKHDLVGKNMNIELEKEVEDLKELTKVDETLSSFNKINATVIERNHSYWLNSLTINKGKKDGIDIGMAVVVSEGLIGKIIKITNNTSVVQLITSDDNKNKISVKIKDGETYIYKILEHQNGNLVIDGIPNDSSVESGTIILTSGLSDIYPSGIIIGTVGEIKNDKYGVSKKIIVSSKVNFDNLRYVTVLERLLK